MLAEHKTQLRATLGISDEHYELYDRNRELYIREEEKKKVDVIVYIQV